MIRQEGPELGREAEGGLGARRPACGTRLRAAGEGSRAAAVDRAAASRALLVSRPDRRAGKEFEAFALFKLPVDSP